MPMRRLLFRVARATLILAIAGCTQRVLPASGLIPPPEPIPVVEAPPDPAPPASVPAPPAPCRFIAFTACRAANGEAYGGLFLWDEAVQDIYLLGGALSGLWLGDGCEGVDELAPRVLFDGRVLFSHAGTLYLWEPLTETRATLAIDAHAHLPRARITADGLLVAYVSRRGTVVLKEADGAYFTKTRELTAIAAEAEALARLGAGGVIRDLDLSGDGRFLALILGGSLYLYDVKAARLSHLLPLAPGGDEQAIAISHEGRFVAIVADGRLLVLDRTKWQLDPVPYANLGLVLSDHPGRPAAPRFCDDGRALLFAYVTPYRRWLLRYDVQDGTLRGLTLLNNALGALPR